MELEPGHYGLELLDANCYGYVFQDFVEVFVDEQRLLLDNAQYQNNNGFWNCQGYFEFILSTKPFVA